MVHFRGRLDDTAAIDTQVMDISDLDGRFAPGSANMAVPVSVLNRSSLNVLYGTSSNGSQLQLATGEEYRMQGVLRHRPVVLTFQPTEVR